MLIKCKICNKDFEVKNSHLKRLKWEATCSYSCAGKLKSLKRKGVALKKYRTSWGYNYLFLPKHPKSDKEGYLAEHRFIMEKHIGRYLTKKELVHHKNGNRKDNRIENLELLTFSEHAKLHSKENIKKLAKINKRQAELIKKSEKTVKELAKEFKLCKQSIYNIKNNLTWT